MMRIRMRDTGVLLRASEFRAMLAVALPNVLTDEILDEHGADFVNDTNAPTPVYWYEQAIPSGVTEVNGKWEFTWAIVPADPSPSMMESLIAERKADLQERISIERDKRFYSNVTVQFPDGPGEVQFRDEIDRANFSGVVQGAQVALVNNQPNAPVSYITGDNTIRTLTAAEMVAIGVQILANKQAIIQGARAAKDYVLGTDDVNVLNSYNPATSW